MVNLLSPHGYDKRNTSIFLTTSNLITYKVELSPNKYLFHVVILMHMFIPCQDDGMDTFIVRLLSQCDLLSCDSFIKQGKMDYVKFVSLDQFFCDHINFCKFCPCRALLHVFSTA